MAVSPLDPQSVRLSIASDMANTLFLLFMVSFVRQLDINGGGLLSSGFSLALVLRVHMREK